MPLEAIRKIVGHADERTTLHNYCFNRLTDEQTYNKVLSALSADKENEPSEESVIPKWSVFHKRKNVENLLKSSFPRFISYAEDGT